MTQAFIDASSAILLNKADLFFSSARAFTLLMPKTVFNEITRRGYPDARAFVRAREQRVFRVRSSRPTADHLSPDLERLDPGERETIALYLEYSGTREKGFVIIDDFKGAKFCRRHNIPYMNALLVPKVFWYSGIMDRSEYQKATNRILGLGRYSKQIIEKALELTQKDLGKFSPDGGCND